MWDFQIYDRCLSIMYHILLFYCFNYFLEYYLFIIRLYICNKEWSWNMNYIVYMSELNTVSYNEWIGYLILGTKQYHGADRRIATTEKVYLSGGMIDDSACDFSKGCYRIPKGCTYGTDCDVLVTWQDRGDSFYFEMDYVIDPNLGTDVWAAIGFSDDHRMVNGNKV